MRDITKRSCRNESGGVVIPRPVCECSIGKKILLHRASSSN